MSGRFDVRETSIRGLVVLQRKPVGDSRGYLERMFCAEELRMLIPPAKNIAQINHSLTVRPGTVRGLHFQYPPSAETKFVNCLHGEVFDVAVDLRHGSPTFLQWHGEILSAANHHMLVVPEGFAHGFQALTENCELVYFVTAVYQPAAEGALNAQDPALGIQWPEPITELSPRDAGHPMVTSEFAGISL
jgi:dTDP-4-dehydrorhamnose 3,5-epimerase